MHEENKMKGHIAWNKGKKLSKEIVENMKRNRIGMLGKKHTFMTKLKISAKNKDKHYSPETEFKKGGVGFPFKHSEESKLKMSLISKGKHYAPHNEFKIYDFGKRHSKKINGKSYLISHLNWCKANNIHRVPFSNDRNGGMIHHIDGDRENNNPENLQLMTRDFHIKLHRSIL